MDKLLTYRQAQKSPTKVTCPVCGWIAASWLKHSQYANQPHTSKINSVGTFNAGSCGRSVGCATGSLTQVALTGYGYLY